ncbi:MAG: amidohydrolase family protein [Mailhella sp.]|nr:amidohydrolase family protein [Mailhella sp.]
MFVDCHTHVFPPSIAAKACRRLTRHYGLAVHCEGTPEDLLRRAAAAGIDHCVALCAATSADQVRPCNVYAGDLESAYPQITAFGTIHPDCMDWKDHLDSLRKMGIRGIKLHPDFQHFRLDDPRLLPIFEEARHDFIFLIHIGDSLPPEENPSCPYKMAAVLDSIPGLKVIAAHLGGYRHWQYSLEALAGRDVWMDTSSCMQEISDEHLKAILAKHPRDRLLFGTDYPIMDPRDEIQLLQQRTGFTDAELEELLENGSRLLFG